MLVLSRLIGESITLDTRDGPVIVKVSDIRDGCRVRLAVEAPDSVEIHRSEITDWRRRQGR